MAAVVPTFVHDDVDEAIDALRPQYALYIGGMGARDENYHYEVFARMLDGRYEGDCAKIQDLYLEGRKAEATAAVPAALIDDVALVGSADRIRDRAQRWEDSIVDTLLIGGPGRSSSRPGGRCSPNASRGEARGWGRALRFPENWNVF